MRGKYVLFETMKQLMALTSFNHLVRLFDSHPLPELAYYSASLLYLFIPAFIPHFHTSEAHFYTSLYAANRQLPFGSLWHWRMAIYYLVCGYEHQPDSINSPDQDLWPSKLFCWTGNSNQGSLCVRWTLYPLLFQKKKVFSPISNQMLEKISRNKHAENL